jgi:hypothetical protein
LLAATALHHGLTLVTRNVTHARRSGVEVLNPFVKRTSAASPRHPSRTAVRRVAVDNPSQARRPR